MYRQSSTELKSTISTMKVILLFALFGLSYCQDSSCSGITVSNPDDDNCLILAIKEFGYFLSAFGKFYCAYNKFQEDKNEENYNAAAKPYIIALTCIGCHPDKIIGKGHTLEELLKGVGETGSAAYYFVTKVLQILGLDETTAKLICTLAGDLLQSPCLQKALVNIAPDILIELNKLYCQLKESGATGAAAGLTKLLEKLECALDKKLGLKDGELEKLLGALGSDLLEQLVGKLLLLTGKVDLANKLLCTMINPLPSNLI
ncbi:uncharacterized protein [Aquarana catesbeiana]|uniref:uncharacterized protein n=1 Tax=Aquarana catesbeiana TaxID=8400 RepID=UPI003CCA54B8